MPIKSFRPVTHSRRFMTVVTRDEITKQTPEKSLVESKKRTRRPQQHRPGDLALHRRRRQAGLPA